MKQTRLMSLVEAVAKVVLGYGLAVATQLLVFPLFERPADVGVVVALGAVFTVISLVRSSILRRLFEWAGAAGVAPNASPILRLHPYRGGGARLQGLRRNCPLLTRLQPVEKR